MGIGNKVNRVTWLVSGEEIRFEQVKDVVTLFDMPTEKPDDLPLMIKFELDGAPVGIPNPMQPNMKVKFEGE